MKKNENIENSSLHTAVKVSDRNLIAWLIIHGAEVNQPNPQNETPLHQACLIDRPRIVDLLIDKKADMTTLNSQGWSALGCAASQGHAANVKVLLEHHAPVNQIKNGITALFCAAYYFKPKGNRDLLVKQARVIQLLLNASADVNLRPVNKFPTHYYLCHDNKTATRLILRKKPVDIEVSSSPEFPIAQKKINRLRQTEFLLQLSIFKEKNIRDIIFSYQSPQGLPSLTS